MNRLCKLDPKLSEFAPTSVGEKRSKRCIDAVVSRWSRSNGGKQQQTTFITFSPQSPPLPPSSTGILTNH